MATFLSSYSLTTLAKNGLDPISKGIISEIRNSKNALCRIQSVERKNLKLGLIAYLDRSKESRNQFQRSHILESLVGQNPYVFKVVALLDETDRVFNAPTGEIGLNNPPESFSIPAHRFSGQQHQRLRSKPFTTSHHYSINHHSLFNFWGMSC